MDGAQELKAFGKLWARFFLPQPGIRKTKLKDLRRPDASAPIFRLLSCARASNYPSSAIHSQVPQLYLQPFYLALLHPREHINRCFLDAQCIEVNANILIATGEV